MNDSYSIEDLVIINVTLDDIYNIISDTYTETISNDDLLSLLDFLAQLIVYCGLGIYILLLIFSHWYYYSIAKKCCDMPNYASLFRWIQSMIDFWTDVIFAIVLYLQDTDLNLNYLLFYASMIFTILPYILSLLIAVYWIVRWNRWKNEPNRLKTYLNKYEMIILLCSLITGGGGFFTTIELFQSKLMSNLFGVFYISLKKEEFNQLRYYKFFTVIICENIPQFIIQCLFLHNSYSKVNINDETQGLAIVFITLILTLISLLMALLSIITYFIKQVISNNKSGFMYQTNIAGHFKIDCQKLNKHHLFAHNKISKCLKQVFDGNYHRKNSLNGYDMHPWVGRNDVFYTFEVYWIQDNRLLNCVTIYFDLYVLTMETNHANVMKEMVSLLNQMVNVNLLKQSNSLSPACQALTKVKKNIVST